MTTNQIPRHKVFTSFHEKDIEYKERKSLSDAWVGASWTGQLIPETSIIPA